MSSKLLVALVVGVILTLAALLAWPDVEVRESLSATPPRPPRVTVSPNASLSQSSEQENSRIESASVTRRQLSAGDSTGALADPATEPTTRRTIHARLVDSSGVALSEGQLLIPEFSASANCNENGEVTVSFEAPNSWEPSNNRLYVRAEAPKRAVQRTLTPIYRELELWLGDLELKRAVPIEGRVIDSQGTPVVGAIVVARDYTIDGRESDQEATREYGPARKFDTYEAFEARPYSTTTDSSGRFVIDDFFADWLTVFARRAPDRWAFISHLRMVEGQAGLEVELTLEDPEERDWIRGQVQSSTGEPLASIRVDLNNADTSAGYRRLTRETDNDGRFDFLVARDSMWNLSAHPEEWARDTSFLPDVPSGTEGLTVILQDTEWFWAHVADEEGNPQTEGKVSGFNADWYEEHQRIPHAQRVVSDLWDDGRARLRITEERIYLIARVVGFEEQILGPFAPGWREDVQFTLAQKPMLRGIVKTNGVPLSDATVALYRFAPSGKEIRSSYWDGHGEPFAYDASTRATTTAKCTKNGRFQLEHPTFNKRIAEARFLVRAQSTSTASADLGPYSLDELLELREIEFELSGGGAVQGRLELPHGEKSVGWSVFAMSDHGEFAKQVVGQRGQYAFERLRPGDWQLRAFSPGDTFSSGARHQERQERQTDVRVIEGKIVHANVKVELQEFVVLQGKLALKGEPLQPWRVRLWNEKAGSEMVMTDAQGRFRIETREAGQWQLMLNAKNWNANLFGISDTLELQRGMNTWEHELELGIVTPKLSLATLEEYFTTRALLYRGPGELRVIQSLNHRDDGDYPPFLFPLGKAELLDSGLAWNQEPRDPTIVAREYTFERGSELTIGIP